MSDWQIGDLAVCVDNAPRPTSAPEGLGTLQTGAVYTVAQVHPHLDGIWLTEIPTLCAFYADRFRKIRPDEHESCEPEFVQLLKRSKQRIDAYDPYGPLGIAAE